ncbi:MAG: hypothetical protein ACYCWW_05145 [Deltaproteobacteria bacterium]
MACLAVACGGPPEGPERTDPCEAARWWLLPHTVPESQELNTTAGVTTRFDDDLELPAGTPVQLRGSAQLLAQATYPWGWQPTFVDLGTGHVFRLLHLRPEDARTTEPGALYPAGTIVGRSGGDTWETGFMRRACAGRICSNGAHLCVQGDAPFSELFPPDGSSCPEGSAGAIPTPTSLVSFLNPQSPSNPTLEGALR